LHFACKCITFAKFSANLLHFTIYCWLVLRHVSAWFKGLPAVQQVSIKILWILYNFKKTYNVEFANAQQVLLLTTSRTPKNSIIQQVCIEFLENINFSLVFCHRDGGRLCNSQNFLQYNFKTYKLLLLLTLLSLRLYICNTTDYSA
jgi:hypothetical protein